MAIKPVKTPKLLSRLTVIPTTDTYPVQDCGACRNAINCWCGERGKDLKEEHIITNLLVCRIKRGIEVNRSVKLFLQMVRPALKTYAKKAIHGTNIDLEIALADMESQTIEYLQNYYVMGEIAYPMHYLFGMPHGVIRHFANNYARKTRKYEETHVLNYDVKKKNRAAQAIEDGYDTREPFEPEQPPEEDSENDLTRVAREVIDDGVTLTLDEYRVLKFCLTNASEQKRPLNGLHVYLSRSMNEPRTRITKKWSDSTKKLVAEVQS